MTKVTLIMAAGLALTGVTGTGFTAAPAAAVSADDQLTKVKAWAEGTLAPFMQGNKVLLEEVTAANKERESWAAYSEDYKKWTPEDAEKNKASYTYCEYLWSVKKDKEFRAKHMSTPAAKAMKEFQSGSGEVVSECFVTDAKGGNVVQSQATSDWFQGDEAKFTDCAGKGVIAYGKPTRDETTGVTGVHVSVPLFDANKKVSGVAIVLVTIEKVK
ncbi:MAG: PDC sensor domain-containing protein [Phycisphaerales bacterium]